MHTHCLLPTKALSRLYLAVAVFAAIFSFALFAGSARAAVGSNYLVTFAAGTSESDQVAAIANAGGTDVSEVAPLRMR